MKTTFRIFCFILVLLPQLEAQVVQDPVADFLAHNTRKPNDQLYKVATPVNRNGGLEVFLTYSSSMANGHAGYVWVIYAPVDGGYQSLSTLITFKPGTLTVGDFKELGGLGMLTYAPDAGGKGSLIGYIFDGTNVQQMNLGRIEFSGKDKALTDKYFTKDRHPALVKTPADKLPKIADPSH
jgi:hypothetical protein